MDGRGMLMFFLFSLQEKLRRVGALVLQIFGCDTELKL